VGLLIADAETGETLYELNADKYFVPASNMKLFTTALALAKLGPDYRFRTTLETRGTVSPEGVLNGDLFLVGRGDPNLSNRKFPYDLKEEFDDRRRRPWRSLPMSWSQRGSRKYLGMWLETTAIFHAKRIPAAGNRRYGLGVWRGGLRDRGG